MKGTMPQHSPLPWAIEPHEEKSKIFVVGPDKIRVIATLFLFEKRLRESQKANAAHIVRCVNNAEKLAEAIRGAIAALSQPVQFGNEKGGAIQIIQGDCKLARDFLSAALADWQKEAHATSKRYKRLCKGDPMFDYVECNKAAGNWVCDARDHNSPRGCPNPSCFNFVKPKVVKPKVVKP